MTTVKANFIQVQNTNPVTEEVTTELQGSAILKSIGTNWLETKSDNPKKYKIGTIVVDANGSPEVKSAQIFEATINGNEEKGTVAVQAGDVVAINVSADDNNTYFRVIGTGASLDSKDTFAALLQGSKPMVAASEAAPAMEA